MQFALRGGGIAEIRGDTLVAGDQNYPVRDIAWVGLVVDPATASPGAPPNPAVGVQMRDGSHTALAPADPPDAWRLLGALHEARPDLRGPVPPPPGAQPPGAQPPGAQPPGAQPPPPYGYPPYGYAAPRPSNSDNVLAGLAHLSVFFAPVIFPLIIWIAMRKSSPYTSYQGKQAFVFHLFFWVLSVTAVVVFIFYGGFFGPNSPFFSPISPNGPSDFTPFFVILGFDALLGVLSLVQTIFSIIGAVQTFQGKPFHYPLLGWL
jgi:uncharacterized Tic20 family protein